MRLSRLPPFCVCRSIDRPTQRINKQSTADGDDEADEVAADDGDNNHDNDDDDNDDGVDAADDDDAAAVAVAGTVTGKPLGVDERRTLSAASKFSVLFIERGLQTLLNAGIVVGTKVRSRVVVVVVVVVVVAAAAAARRLVCLCGVCCCVCGCAACTCALSVCC